MGDSARGGVTIDRMETLKPGRGKRGWSTTAECSGKGNGSDGCGATLRVDQEDLFTTEVPHDARQYVTFKCHECGALTDLGDTYRCDIPDDIVIKLPPQHEWEARKGNPDVGQSVGSGPSNSAELRTTDGATTARDG